MKNSTLKEIRVVMAAGANFTPAGLMRRYAQQTPGAEVVNGPFFDTRLQIGGIPYRYHHWSITAENGAQIVTLYMEEVRK